MVWPLIWPFVDMPGRASSLVQNLTTAQEELKSRLARTILKLSEEIGERNDRHPDALESSRSFIADSFRSLGYSVEELALEFPGQTQSMHNIIAEKKGGLAPGEIVVVGAHYDTVYGSPGADDNASGIASLIEMARALSKDSSRRTIRFCAFANEEHPGAAAETMGSYMYAAACRERDDRIVSMLSLEMLGFYDSSEGSQKYPQPLGLFYPSRGNFVAFVGNLESGGLVRRCVKVFRSIASVPSEGVVAPRALKEAARSDHWGFWQHDYPALMVTDTAEYRNRNYHTAGDTIATLDLDRLTLATEGLIEVARDLLASRRRFGPGTIARGFSKILDYLFGLGLRTWLSRGSASKVPLSDDHFRSAD